VEPKTKARSNNQQATSKGRPKKWGPPWVGAGQRPKKNQNQNLIQVKKIKNKSRDKGHDKNKKQIKGRRFWVALSVLLLKLFDTVFG
jgi:hypothetical protein